MNKLEVIYSKAGLTKVGPDSIIDEKNYKSKGYDVVDLGDEKFYINWGIALEIAKSYGGESDSNKVEEYFSIENMVEEDIIYSSKIEGINITKDDLKKQDTEEVELNSEYKETYAKAYSFLFSQEQINHKVLKEAIDIMCKSKILNEQEVVGKDKMYRDGPVGIFKQSNGLDIKIHDGVSHGKIKRYLDTVFKYMNEYMIDSNIPQNLAIRVGITHTLFEYVHPYFDGNGRVGRMLINWLLRKSPFPEASYFLSEIISNNKSKYYKSLEDSQKTKNLSYHSAFIFAAMNESVDITGKIAESIIKVDEKISNTQIQFLKKLLISGMNSGKVSYPEIKVKFKEQSRQSFHKMADKLVSMNIIKKEETSKVVYYSYQE